MDHNFTKQLKEWYDTPAHERDYSKGALMLLQLSNNQIMFRNLMVNPTRRADFITAQIKKYLDFRLQALTHEEVEQMTQKVELINVEHGLDKSETATESSSAASADSANGGFKAGMRADHDALPAEVQALYVENATIMKQMRELHLKLRTLSVENATCPDSERYPFLKELIALDRRYHKNWQIYDSYDPSKSAEEQASLIEDARMAEKNIYRQINLAKGRYKKNPSEKMREQIASLYAQLPSPPESLTAELKELGIIDNGVINEDSAEVAETEAPSVVVEDNNGAEDESTAE